MKPGIGTVNEIGVAIGHDQRPGIERADTQIDVSRQGSVAGADAKLDIGDHEFLIGGQGKRRYSAVGFDSEQFAKSQNAAGVVKDGTGLKVNRLLGALHQGGLGRGNEAGNDKHYQTDAGENPLEFLLLKLTPGIDGIIPPPDQGCEAAVPSKSWQRNQSPGCSRA